MILSLIESSPETWHLFSAPTNTGKSLIELAVLSKLPQSILITPRLEIIAGMMEKVGYEVSNLSDDKLCELAWNSWGITTPIRLKNMLVLGDMPYRPTVLIIDESHHALAATYKDVNMYLNGVPVVGLTATPFRGTPKETREFYRQWNDTVNEILSLRTAVEMGYYHMPDVTVWPLIDDDLVDVSAGEFRVSTVDKILGTSVDLLVSNCKKMFDKETRLWDMPTIISVSSRASVECLAGAFRNAGIPVSTVTQETHRFDRIKAFESVVECRSALIQINVVSEGVDLSIRRIIDASPTLSPVKWFQQVGRIRSNTDSTLPPEYICCCRNLERHCYLWEGLLPNSKIIEAQEAFTDENGTPMFSKRSGTRVVGLEGLGKFVQTPVHLMNGTVGFMYNLVNVENNVRNEYLAYVHPNSNEIVYGIKQSLNTNGEMRWGTWRLTPSLPDLKGCMSVKVNDLSPNQRKKWYERAAFCGLNPHRELNSREFCILHFLLNTGLSFRS